jgi:hypothetical protein
MSTDIWLYVECDRHHIQIEETSRNYTSNCNKMLYTIKPNFKWSDFNHRPACEVAPKIMDFIIDLEMNPDKFRAMNPTNGWGHYVSFVEFLQAIWRDCQKYPSALVGVWI